MTEQDGFADTPGREATPEEEIRVQALLASLRDDDVPMPDHVWSRLSAVIAEEHVAATARHLSGAPAPLGDHDIDPSSPAADPLASVTVLPTPEQRTRRGAPRWLLGAAAAAVVVLIAGGLVKGLGTGASPSSGGSATVAEASAGPTASAESRSNTAYTQRDLTGQVGRLVTGSLAGKAQSSTAGSTGAGTDSFGATVSTAEGTPAAITPQSAPRASPSSGSMPLATGGAPPLLAGQALTACLTQLTGGATAAAVAVDRGTFEGKPADVVVVPTADDPGSLDVWVLAPGCTANDADVLNFSRIARP